MQAREVNAVNLNACYVGQVGMHQGRFAFNKTRLLKLWRVLIFKSFERFTPTLHNHHIQANNKNK
jgi:hypothetical protein